MALSPLLLPLRWLRREFRRSAAMMRYFQRNYKKMCQLPVYDGGPGLALEVCPGSRQRCGDVGTFCGEVCDTFCNPADHLRRKGLEVRVIVYLQDWQRFCWRREQGRTGTGQNEETKKLTPLIDDAPRTCRGSSVYARIGRSGTGYFFSQCINLVQQVPETSIFRLPDPHAMCLGYFSNYCI